jgi:hypothetical protein
MNNTNRSPANYGIKLAWFYEFEGMPVDPFTLEQLQHFITLIPYSTITRATGLSRSYLNKIRDASDSDIFRRKPAMTLQSYMAETLAPFGLKPL